MSMKELSNDDIKGFNFIEVNDSNRITMDEFRAQLAELDRQDYIKQINKGLLEVKELEKAAENYMTALTTGVDLVHPFTGQPMGIELMLKFYNQKLESIEEIQAEIHLARTELGELDKAMGYSEVDKSKANSKLQDMLALKASRKLTASEQRQLNRLLAKEREAI